MTEDIRLVEVLTDEEKQQLFGWGENIFGVASFKINWRPKDLHFPLYSNADPVSHVGILKHIISVNNEPLTVGGVGGVVTVAKAQKKGFARHLMKHTARFFEQEWKVDAGLLFCLPKLVMFYQTLGWQEVQNPVLIEQPEGRIVSPLRVMVLPFREEGLLSGNIDLQSFPW